MALRMSLSNLLKRAKTKNGIAVIDAVEARGSAFFNPNINAPTGRMKAISKVMFFPKTRGKVLSPADSSPFTSGRVVNRATEAKQKI